MAILIYVEKWQKLYLTKVVGGSLREIGNWPAHNDAASSSAGPWPCGTYRWSHFNPHAEMGYMPASLNTSYGATGIHVFSVPGRSGMGVHAGRSVDYAKTGGKTLGCIRTSTSAMFKINDSHKEDALTHIAVVREFSAQAYTSPGSDEWIRKA